MVILFKPRYACLNANRLLTLIIYLNILHPQNE